MNVSIFQIQLPYFKFNEIKDLSMAHKLEIF
jgi:hypothetical protein